MDKSWLLSQNIVSFEHFFIKWLLSQDTSRKTIYFGGSHKSDQNICILASTAKAEPLLRCFHEKAEDRIMYHLSHTIQTYKYRSVIILSPDTDAPVCVIYNYSHLLYFGLDELWFITGKKNSRKFFPVYEVLNKIEPDVLPVLHALTGCESTSKVSTKAAALSTAIESGRSKVTEDLIANAKKFLNRCLSLSSICTHFDHLRYDIHHKKKFQFDLEKYPATSESMKQHILYAYFQAISWQHASFVDQISLISEEYGYVEDEKEQLRPFRVSASKLPNDFPVSSSCSLPVLQM